MSTLVRKYIRLREKQDAGLAEILELLLDRIEAMEIQQLRQHELIKALREKIEEEKTK